jgi:hypothetical protein
MSVAMGEDDDVARSEGHGLAIWHFHEPDAIDQEMVDHEVLSAGSEHVRDFVRRRGGIAPRSGELRGEEDGAGHADATQDSEIASIHVTLCKIRWPLRKGVCATGRSGKRWRRSGMVSSVRLQQNCIPESD